MYDKIYVVDTNIILESANNISKLSQNSSNLVVIPDTVLKELRKYKVGFEDINYNARVFNRLLGEAELISSEKNIVKLKYSDDFGNTEVLIVKLNFDDSNVENDDKIVAASVYLDSIKDKYTESEVVMVSNDIDVRTSAILEGISTDTMKANEIKEDNFDFHMDIETELVVKEGMSITDIGIALGKDIPSYTSNFEFLNPITGDKNYFYNNHGVLAEIKEELYSKQKIMPLNMPQKVFATLIQDTTVDIVVVEARAGSGKNVVSLSGAMRLLDRHKDKYNKIIYIRKSLPSVDKEAQIGFLKGSAAEKLSGFSMPLLDTVSFMVEKEYSRKKDKLTKEALETGITDMINKYNIESVWEGDLRGRTLSKCVVIIDEASNFSKKSFQLILTRMGSDCKVLVIGSNRQNDSHYLNKYNNGLTHTLKLCQSEIENNVTVLGCNLKKAVRSEIAEWADSAYE